MTGKPDTQNMAVFCDFENVALGVEDAVGGGACFRLLLPVGAPRASTAARTVERTLAEDHPEESSE